MKAGINAGIRKRKTGIPANDYVQKLANGGGSASSRITSGSKVWRYSYRIHGKQKTDHLQQPVLMDFIEGLHCESVAYGF